MNNGEKYLNYTDEFNFIINGHTHEEDHYTKGNTEIYNVGSSYSNLQAIYFNGKVNYIRN